MNIYRSVCQFNGKKRRDGRLSLALVTHICCKTIRSVQEKEKCKLKSKPCCRPTARIRVLRNKVTVPVDEDRPV